MTVTALNVNNVFLSFNLSQTKPALGTAATPQMDLQFSANRTSTTCSTVNCGQVWMYASDTGYTGGLPGFNATAGGTQAPGASSVLFGVTTNTANSNATLSAALTGGTTTLNGPIFGSPFGTSFFVPGASGAPYSLTLMASVFVASPGITTGDFNVQSVPEPGSMLLIGTGLLGLGASARRRWAKK